MTGQKDLDAWLDEFAPAMADGSQSPAAPVEENIIQASSWLDEPIATSPAVGEPEDFSVPALELTPTDLGDDAPAALGTWPEPDGPIPGWDVGAAQPSQPAWPSPAPVAPIDPYGVQPVAPDPYAQPQSITDVRAPQTPGAPYIEPAMRPPHQPQQAIDFQPPVDPFAGRPAVAPVPGFEYEPVAAGAAGVGMAFGGVQDQRPVAGSQPVYSGGDTILGAPEPAETSFLDAFSENSAGRFALEWLPILIGAAIVALLVRAFIFQAYFIPSGSMIPTLQADDRVLVNKQSYNFHEVNRGDVVVFARPANEDPNGIPDLIKRVIALPGETIQLRNGDVYVNGALVRESYLAEPVSTRPLRNDAIPGCIDGDPINCTVPEGYVFVMGDNRTGSRDSREFGPVPIDSIVGRSFVRVWPLTHLGLL